MYSRDTQHYRNKMTIWFRGEIQKSSSIDPLLNGKTAIQTMVTKLRLHSISHDKLEWTDCYEPEGKSLYFVKLKRPERQWAGNSLASDSRAVYFFLSFSHFW